MPIYLVKVPGGRICLGGVHATQGDGEMIGHTVDVPDRVTLKVELVKGLQPDGTTLFPLLEDPSFLARRLSAEKWNRDAGQRTGNDGG
jgi:formamidase